MDGPADPFDGHLILIRWDDDEGRVTYDLGGMDPWTAVAVLGQVLDAVTETLPLPRDVNEPVEETDD